MNNTEKNDKITEIWYKNKIYDFDLESIDSEKFDKDNIFSIDTPPPTISGVLHIGHVFSYCHTDFIARFQRMNGKDVFYPIGFDCNGLPTEKLVEKTFGKRAKDYLVNDKPDFKDRCSEVINSAIPEFQNLFKRIGLSIDYNLQYTTMDERCQKIAFASFNDLKQKELVYQAYKPVFWDWIDGTAIAQAEIDNREFEGEMHDIVFKTNSGEKVIIATTRPEMLLSCFCIFVHPDDLKEEGRYSHLKGQFLITPLYEKKIPVLADEDVIKDKGTGIMMCCAFGDELDLKRYEKYKSIYPEHFPELTTIDFPIEKSGLMSAKALFILQNRTKENYKIEEFRKLLIEELKVNNLLTNTVKVVQIVNCAERSGGKLEIIPSKQWYVKIANYKENLLNEAKKIKWLPQEMFEKIRVWIENLRQDWCISRDRYWGIKIPNDAEPDVHQVFDTWFISSLSPIINSLSNQNFTIENALKKSSNSAIAIMNLRPQAHEIIRTWAFYTIAKSYMHFGANQLPWKNIMISGWCLAKDGGKMSKSKGNIIEPLKLLENFKPDAIRYWSASSNLGADSRYDENTLKIGNKLIKKLENVVNFLQHLLTPQHVPETKSNIETFSESDWQERNRAKYRCSFQVPCILKRFDETKINQLMDIWIMNKFVKVVENIESHLTNFEYSKALNSAETFFWKDFCDNYIEICKARAYGENPEILDSEYISALTTLAIIITNLLKMFAIYLPFTSEKLYLALFDDEILFPDEISIHRRGNWIKSEKLQAFRFYDHHHSENGEILIRILEEVRKYKGSLKLSIKTPINLTVYYLKENFKDTLEEFKFDLISVANIANLKAKKFEGEKFNVKIDGLGYLTFEIVNVV